MTTFLRKFSGLMITSSFLLVSGHAYGKVSINSQCYMNIDNGSKEVVGTNVEKDFELASVSKMVTTFWAINKLTPHYRFQTKLHITPLAGETFDVHIEGDKDPYFGQHMTYFLVSELNKMGIKNIERLSFDENFDINWNVRSRGSQAARSYDPSPANVRTTLESVLIKNTFIPDAYKNIRATAKEKFGIEMAATAGLKVRRVEHISKSDFRGMDQSKSKTMVLRSAPLYRYLKEMNIYSNNYVADLLFAKLGGVDNFQKFIKAKLALDSSDINFVNGSGDSEYTDTGKLYNKGSCSALVKILLSMRNDLMKNGLDLNDVMAVSGSDTTSTLGGRYAGMPNTVVAKTGSVNPAITLSGMIATEKGDLLFAVLMKTDGPADWTAARNSIRTEVGKMISKNGGASKIKYTPSTFLPFDAKSVLQAEVSTKGN